MYKTIEDSHDDVFGENLSVDDHIAKIRRILATTQTVAAAIDHQLGTSLIVRSKESSADGFM